MELCQNSGQPQTRGISQTIYHCCVVGRAWAGGRNGCREARSTACRGGESPPVLLLPRPVAPEVLRADVPCVCRGLRPRAGAQERQPGARPWDGKGGRGRGGGGSSQVWGPLCDPPPAAVGPRHVLCEPPLPQLEVGLSCSPLSSMAPQRQ